MKKEKCVCIVTIIYQITANNEMPKCINLLIDVKECLVILIGFC